MNLKTPTLLIDKQKCLNNIDRMIRKASSSQTSLRPHFKTHFSSEIASWFRAKGINKCTVSSVMMAQYFADHGWKDITIAFPYNRLEANELSDLAQNIHINILIESKESLSHALNHLHAPVGYFIKIDVGSYRTGIDPRNQTLIKYLVDQSSEKLKYHGMLAHAGHTYGCHDIEGVEWIVDGAAKVLTELQASFGGIISYGDTPSCSMVEDLSFCDELRPGNFIFYDWMQHTIGSCTIDQMAVCLACPIVAIHQERNELVVYGGAVHLSKDMITEKDLYDKTKNCYGKMVLLSEAGWGSEIVGHVDRLSQEHGIIKTSPEVLAGLKVGDIIGILPVHSCLTADLQPYYLSTTGKRLEKMMKN